jgi:phospholipid/cholesterol/gamma-HCH transport system substrate-binding protein
LATALGPNGANKHGALDDLMHAGASALKGQGAKGNKMIVAMSKAVKTFGDGSGQLFATVRGLAQFSNALARNDRFVSAFITHLATVSTQLAGERGELRAALARLAGAVGVVRTFVHDNKGKLEGDLKALTQVSTTLAQEKNNIAIALEKAPLGLNNLALGYDNQSNGEGGGFNMKANVSSVHLFLCALVRADKLPDANVACKVFTKLLGPLEDRAGQSSGPPTPTLPKILKNGNRLKLGKSTPVTSLSGLLGGSR